MQLLDDSEKEDFNALLKKHGFDVHDFSVEESLSSPKTTVFKIVGRVLVTRDSKGCSKEYVSSHGNAWLQVFETDLSAGVFN